MKIENYKKEKSVYIGSYKNTDRLLTCASGGFCSAISEQILSRGGVVYGVQWSSDFKSAEFVRISESKNLYKLRGSKYVSATKEVVINGQTISLWRAVAEDLTNELTVLFIGLGCEVAALVSYIRSNKINAQKLYTVDLICHGPTFKEVLKSYAGNLEKRYKSRICSINMKYKKYGWNGDDYIWVKFENGKTFEEKFYGSDFGKAFSILKRTSCFNCKFKGGDHISNITAGDYWGITPEMQGYNSNGVSVLVVNDQKGHELLEFINDEIFKLTTGEMEIVKANNPMYWKSTQKAPNFEQFQKTFHEKGLERAVTDTLTFKQKLRRTYRHIRQFLK